MSFDSAFREDFLPEVQWDERPIRVLVGDDHSLFRRGLLVVLEEEADLEVLGEGDHGPEVVSLVEELAPDVVLIDGSLPPYGGVAAVAQIGRTVPTAHIVLLTADERDTGYLLEGIGAGAMGVMVKETALDLAPDVVRRAARGECVFTPKVATAVREFVEEDPDPPAGLPRLSVTERERLLIDVVARGAGSKAAAAGLGVDEATARNLLVNLVRRLQRFWRADDVVVSLARQRPGTAMAGIAEAAQRVVDEAN